MSFIPAARASAVFIFPDKLNPMGAAAAVTAPAVQ